jgi:hypothetical protein
MSDPFKNTTREHKELILLIDSEAVNLSDWEISFIGSIIDRNVYPLTPKQLKVAQEIYDKKVKL